MLLAVILFIAGFLRLGEAGVVEYFHDDGMLATLAQELVTGQRFAWTGIISSTGIPNPPMSVYVLAPLFALSLDPLFAIGGIMLWNVFGVAVLWAMAHRWGGRTVGLLAGLAYAVNPYAVLYSRKLWAQDYHTPFLLLAIALALYGFAEGKRRGWAQALALPVWLVGSQIHFAAWALLPVYALLAWRGRTVWHGRALMASGALAVLVVLPYGVGLAQTLAQDPTRIAAAAERSDIARGFALSGAAWTQTLNLLQGYGMAEAVAAAQADDMAARVPPSPLWGLLPPLAALGAWQLRQQRGLLVAVLAWAFLPALLLTPVWTRVYPHYFVASIPALMWLVGAGAAAVVRAVPSALGVPSAVGERVLLAGVAVLFLTQAMYWRGVLRYVAQTPLDYPAFTTPLQELLPIRDALATFDDVIVLSKGMAWDIDHEAVVWSTLLAGRVTCVRTLRDGYAVLPARPFALLVAPDAPPSPTLAFYAGVPATRFNTRGQSYTLYAHASAPADATAWQDVRADFANGVRLTGYALEATRMRLRFALPFTAPRGTDYQYSAQFFDKDGQRLAQHDARFWHGAHWCAGDMLRLDVPLAPPPQAHTLHVSLYRLTPLGYENSPLTSGEGAAVIILP